MEYVNDAYVITNKISDYNIREMRQNMDENDQDEFDRFIEENWGVQDYNNVDTVPVMASAVDSSTGKKRGRKPKNIDI